MDRSSRLSDTGEETLLGKVLKKEAVSALKGAEEVTMSVCPSICDILHPSLNLHAIFMQSLSTHSLGAQNTLSVLRKTSPSKFYSMRILFLYSKVE